MSPFDLPNYTDKKIRSGKNLSFEEIYFDARLDEPEVMEDEKDPINHRLLGFILLLCFSVLIGRMYFLQAVKGQEYRLVAEGNKLKRQSILAPRGLILDQAGKVIVGNIPSFELLVIPTDLPENEGALNYEVNEIAKITGMEVQEIWDGLSKVNREKTPAFTLMQNLEKDPALILISRKNELKGFLVQNSPIRDYKETMAFSHVVGYTGKITQEEMEKYQAQDYLFNDYVGKSGLEQQYEGFLRGTPGQNQSEINAQGSFQKNLPDVPAKPGNNLKLNIDLDLQKVIYDSVEKVMAARTKSRKGAVVATNPQTGQVLAYLSFPSFDNNWFARGIRQTEYSSLLNDAATPMLNRVISGTYPPGSTVKPMLAIAALTEGIVTPQTKILDDGVIRVGSYTFYGYERSGLGVMDIYSAIARSSDIYFYTVGGGNSKTNILGMGPDKLAEWYRKFNLGSTLGVDLPNEKPGLVPDPEWKKRTRNEPWYLGNTYHYSIGQGDLLVTPLQVNSWTSTIANGGKIMQPYIVDEIMDVDGNLVKKFQSHVLKDNFLDPANVKIAQEGMRQAVTAGSARSLSTLPIEISGKTGTAQFDARDLSSTHAWFTSYAPSFNPQIALTILVEAGGEGSSVSVPIAKEVYTWWAANRYRP